MMTPFYPRASGARLKPSFVVFRPRAVEHLSCKRLEQLADGKELMVDAGGHNLLESVGKTPFNEEDDCISLFLIL